MPLKTFAADPTLALEPPALPSESDQFWAQWEQYQQITDAVNVLGDPLGYGSGATPQDWERAAVASSSSSSSSGWIDIFKDVGGSLVDSFTTSLWDNATGARRRAQSNPATVLAQAEAQRKAEQQKLFLILGGVGAAVVLTAIVLRKKGKG